MGPTLSPETSAFKLQTPGKFPEEYKLHSEHGESLKTTISYLCFTKQQKRKKMVEGKQDRKKEIANKENTVPFTTGCYKIHFDQKDTLRSNLFINTALRELSEISAVCSIPS